MKTIITVKMVPESKDELINTFSSQTRTCIDHFNQLKEEDVFGDKGNIELRYLIVASEFKGADPVIEQQQLE